MIPCFYFRTLTIVSILFLNIYCGGNAEPNKKKNAYHNPKISKDSILSDTFLAQVVDTACPKAIDLRTAKKIEVLSISKKMLKGDTTDEYSEKCKSWSLTIDQIRNVIRYFKPISSEQQNLSYPYMPCRMTGKIKIDNTEFEYWINAGSTLTLKNKEIELYFGCSSKEWKKFFLAGKDLPQKF